MIAFRSLRHDSSTCLGIESASRKVTAYIEPDLVQWGRWAPCFLISLFSTATGTGGTPVLRGRDRVVAPVHIVALHITTAPTRSNRWRFRPSAMQTGAAWRLTRLGVRPLISIQ